MIDFAKCLTDNGWEQDTNEIYNFTRDGIYLHWEYRCGYNFIHISNDKNYWKYAAGTGYILPGSWSDDTVRLLTKPSLTMDSVSMYYRRLCIEQMLEDM